MAATYEILAGETVQELISPTRLADRWQVTARALPSGIVFYVRFAPIISDPVNIDEITSAWAGWLNELSATPGVVAVSWIQGIDDSDQVRDRLAVTVDSSDSKLQFTNWDVPVEQNVSDWQATVAQMRAYLDAIEAQ